MIYRKFSADKIFTGHSFLNNQEVLITDAKGVVIDIVQRGEAGEDIESIIGIICPGFINCHCHLELSHLKGVIPEKTGLVDFILAILSRRNTNEIEILEAIEIAENEMIKNGIVAVGDISNNALSLAQKQRNNLYYHNFIEVSGFSPEIANHRFDAAKEVYHQFKTSFPHQTSVVPHAPYSVSKELFHRINSIEETRLSSIHNQETKEENELFISGGGDFNRLYETIGSDIKSFFHPSGKSSLQTAIPNITRPNKLLLVHNTTTSQDDIDFLNQRNVSTQAIFCLCINANLYIENNLPPIGLFIKNNCEIVLGTDSLASNHGLSILSEMVNIQKHFSGITLENMLSWATFNGAKALGIENKYGSLEKGRKPGIINLDGITKENTLTKETIVRVLL